jgi:hypothetical protein
MMIISKGWFVILSSVALFAANAAFPESPAPTTAAAPAATATSAPSQPHLSATLTNSSIQVGEKATLELRLHAEKETPVAASEGDPTAEPAIHDDLLTQSPRFKVLGKDFKREGNDLVWHYDITSYQTGKLSVPPIAITIGAENYSSESLPLEITTGRKGGDEALRPEFGRIRPPLRWNLIFQGLLGILALIAAAWAYRKYIQPRLHAWRRKIEAAPAPAVAGPRESDEEWLRRKLGELKARLDEAPLPQHLHLILDEFTGVLRQYFARRTRADVTAWTTPEFQKRLSTDPRATATSPVLRRCDEVKFSGRPIPVAPLLEECLRESERVLLAK